MRLRWIIVGVLVIACAVGAALATSGGPAKAAAESSYLTVDLASAAGNATQATGVAAAQVTAIPATLPPEGVVVSGNVLLTPVAASMVTAVQQGQGVSAASAANMFNQGTLPATAQLANVTLQGSPTIQNAACWVVTYTLPQAENVSLGPDGTAPIMMSHQEACIDAQTGAFVLGFYTP